MPNAWDTYNGYIADKRKAGATLEEIGEEVGVTRERVRQILMEHYGTTKMTPFLTTGQLCRLANLNSWTVANYRKRGIIKPINSSPQHLRYGTDALKAILDYRQCKKCGICGKPIPTNRSVYCSSECQREGDRRSHNRFMWRKIRRKRGNRVITPYTEYKKLNTSMTDVKGK